MINSVWSTSDGTWTRTSLRTQDFKSCVSTNSTTKAKWRAKNGIRTRDPDLGKVVLYQLSYFRKKISKKI